MMEMALHLLIFLFIIVKSTESKLDDLEVSGAVCQFAIALLEAVVQAKAEK